ncbi:hypothetical protein PFICI_02192 [Pestalotiopsis fici W106-1]|uniref:Mid2 domain-containing protein n=1 Tax=Pestalotiopsis fici (strain W106-1 / CGMCC3.15140) TaxID=1229662 RepID=W3XFG2_PESFW|nr:uncharacterized protein PFICI_02192 [Pestalotiopsis fici W106-1]ETS84167.1 hypothetical protein PFICI_02192 [Pestalotiopsis fici W106-1]
MVMIARARPDISRLVTTQLQHTYSSQYPKCRTYLWSTDASPGDVFTQYNCDAPKYSGQYFLTPTNPSITSTASTSSTTNGTDTPATTVSSPQQTSTGAQTPEGKTSSAGVVVGAVIGGTALIALIAFGTLFFLRKRKQENLGLGQIPPHMVPSDCYRSPTTATMHGFDSRYSWTGGESTLSPVTPTYYPTLRVPEPFYRRPSVPDHNTPRSIPHDGYTYPMNARKPPQPAPVEMDTGAIHLPELA